MMLENRKILAVIPARGGSKRIPRKNLQLVAGKPLIAWTIDAGKHSRYLDRVIVSTEDTEIAAVAKNLGCEVPFMRPAELATDSASGTAPVLHAMDCLPGYDIVVLLQPTSPLRTAQDIDDCLSFFAQHQARACVSVTQETGHPFNLFLKDQNDLIRRYPFKEPSASGPFYRVNGAVYCAESEWLKENQDFIAKETVGYVMPAERSLDVDTPFDLALADQLLKKMQPKR